MSNIEQTVDTLRFSLLLMSNGISILKVERDGEDGLFVTFSDGTITAYVAEELLELRPHRESVAYLSRSRLEFRAKARHSRTVKGH